MELFSKRKTITSEVSGQKVEFKGIPFGTICKIRNLSAGNKAIAKLVAHYLSDTSKDNDISTTTVVVNPDVEDPNKAMYNTEQVISAAPASVISKRQQDLEDGFAGILNLAMSEEAEDLVAEIIYSSAIEVFEGKSEEEAKKIILEQEAGVIIELLIGAFKASSGVISVLGKLFRLPPTVVEKIEEVLGALN
jgi:hypothetical protein